MRDGTTPPDPPSTAIGFTPEQVGEWVLGAVSSGVLNADELFGEALRSQEILDRKASRDFHELPAHVDPHNLAQAGWGVIYPPRGKERLSDHLKVLTRWRSTLMGREVWEDFIRHGEKATALLERHGESPGTIEPSKVPFYLLLVGSPEEISFEFQFHLSMNHAVGRVWFPDPEGYRGYCEAVVAAERSGVAKNRTVSLFAVSSDHATRAISDRLVPSVRRLVSQRFREWKLEVLDGDLPTKTQLAARVGGGQTPAILLASTHGRRTRNKDRELVQGSLCCVPESGCASPPTPSLFGACDLEERPPKDLHGLVTFMFACNSVGTPVLDHFPHTGEDLPPEAALHTPPVVISDRPLLARLPVTMLRQGALAVVGHVDRAWSTSFVWAREYGGLGTLYSLEDSLYRLLRGDRLGHALRPLSRRYSQLASRLAQLFDLHRIGGQPNLADLGFYWTAVNDARNFVIQGDPAIYLLGQRPRDLMVQLTPDVFERARRVARARKVSIEALVEQTMKRHL